MSVPPCRLRVLRELGRDEHGSDVLDLHLVRHDHDAKTLEHVRQRLRREDRLPLVAALVETDHQAVADKRYWLYALKRRDILDAHRAQRTQAHRGLRHHRRLQLR